MIRGRTPRGRHLFLYDLVATALAIVISFAIRFEANDIVTTMSPYLPAALLPLVVSPVVYVGFGLYRREWQYASIRELYAIAGAVLVAAAVTFTLVVLLATLDAGGAEGFPRSVIVIEALLGGALVGGGRFLLRTSLERRARGSGPVSAAAPTLVYGAGAAGVTATRLIEADPNRTNQVVGFIDDDEHKRGSRLLGLPVLGGLDDLRAAADRTGAQVLLIAMPSAEGAAVRRAFEAGRAAGLEVRTVPSLREVVTGQVPLSRIRGVRLEDLLRRAPIQVDADLISRYLNGASVLVTGGGGSIGGELVRQVLELGPREITVVDNHELALWSIDRDVNWRRVSGHEVTYRSVLLDIRSGTAVRRLMGEVRPDVVFHAAALKHVPIVERFPAEGVLTNIVGTSNVLEASIEARVERFVLISSDKAVEPTSVMGATKRIAEQLTVEAGRGPGRRYAVVRFGNVLGSSGSVIPAFEASLAEGRPLTITHRDATRYFMTIPEAVSLILEAGGRDEPSAIYVLDMGDPVRIIDLAHDLVRLSGRDPDAVPIVFTGLQPGERLHEQLFYAGETVEPTEQMGILRVTTVDDRSAGETLSGLVQDLAGAAWAADDDRVRARLRAAGYLRTAGRPRALAARVS